MIDSGVAQIYDIATQTSFAEWLVPITNIRRVVITNPATNANSIFFSTSLSFGASIVEIKPGFDYVIAIQGGNDSGYSAGDKLGYFKSVGGMVAQVLVTR
jgi:hypothetical protein